jgi:hypothetical protein
MLHQFVVLSILSFECLGHIKYFAMDLAARKCRSSILPGVYSALFRESQECFLFSPSLFDLIDFH